jgi:hypothetical protein
MYTPLFGIIAFVCLYAVAIFLYPGGSQTDTMATSFSFLHNYWCDLFGATAYNGAPNPAQFVAIAAMLVLCPSIALLWWWLPRLFIQKEKNAPVSHKIIRYFGVFAMFALLFLWTSWHDAVVNISGFAGAISLFFFLYELYTHQKNALLGLGLLCVALSGCNYLVYQTQFALFILPVLQKITFVLFFVWAAWINVTINRK